MSLIARGVGHAYGATQVLRDVDLTISAGESVALLGASGSGKSTLLSILGGALSPTSGEVRVCVAGTEMPPARATGAFGWVFQSTNAWSRRSVVDNVAAALLGAGLRHREARPIAAKTLAAVGLGAMRDRRAGTLSGGELQRVCIARALAPEPLVILADEPTGQLDYSTSTEVLDYLFAAVRPPTSLVVATHDRAVAERCTRRLTIVDGHVREAA